MPSILLVEDNEPNRDMLKRRLERKEYRVWVAVDGQEAIDFALERRPDLILMDIGLPKVDGLEATRYLKRQALTQHIPIIVLTANALTEDREKAIAAGCNGFQTKPVDFAKLLINIEQHLTR
ncbi:response regulator [Kordiimonas pumila]|uniref:Response regulator n=1 Tax=Kordiimonas pumila TaxID=2161677 RepID=A0ABV7D4K1_9PROT|nr:response regulator [Kordiimonas pumila]